MAQGLAPRMGGPIAGAVSGRGLRRPKTALVPSRYRGEDAAVQPEVSEALKRPFNLNNRKPKKGAVSQCAGCDPAALTSTMSTTKKGRGGAHGPLSHNLRKP